MSMTEDFNRWWDESPVKANNPYTQNTPAYWAWEGWRDGVEAEREACAKLCAGWSDYTNGIAPTLAKAIRARGQV